MTSLKCVLQDKQSGKSPLTSGKALRRVHIFMIYLQRCMKCQINKTGINIPHFENHKWVVPENIHSYPMEGH